MLFSPIWNPFLFHSDIKCAFSDLKESIFCFVELLFSELYCEMREGMSAKNDVLKGITKEHMHATIYIDLECISTFSTKKI